MAGRPDEFAGGNDAVIGHVHAESVFTEAHDVTAGLAIEPDETFELVGGLADELGSDAHENLTKGDGWLTRKDGKWISLCRGNGRG